MNFKWGCWLGLLLICLGNNLLPSWGMAEEASVPSSGPETEESETSSVHPLVIQSLYVEGLMFLAMAGLWTLPEDVSQWSDKPELTWEGISYRIRRNISQGPVWDGDIRLFNAYSHIHVGAGYTVMCLDHGFSALACNAYANLMSVAWEYGPEAATEIPSWQDLLMTGLVGGRVGIQFHHWKQQINRQGGKVWNSAALGSTFKFLLDPFGYITRGFRDKDSVSIAIRPSLPLQNKENWTVVFRYTF